MPKTESETLFEEFCNANGVRVSRIKEVQGHRRADYKARASSGVAVVEIKEITANKDDIRQEKKRSEQGWSSDGGTPGKRVGRIIRSANSQLTKYSRRGIPTMVVIFDTTYSVHYTDPYNMKTGMYGLDDFVFSRPSDMRERSRVLGVRSGGKQVMTRDHTTSISAVGILQKITKENLMLIVYHNHFARVPLDPECLRAVTGTQMILTDPNGATIPDWTDV